MGSVPEGVEAATASARLAGRVLPRPTDGHGPTVALGGFRVDVVHPDGHAVALVRGEMDHDAPGLWEWLEDSVRQGQRRIVVDLGGVSFLDPAGVRSLLRATKRLREEGGELTLRSPTPLVRKVLEVTGVTKVVLVGP